MTPPAAKKPVKRTVKPVRAAKSTKKPVKRVSKTASKSAKAFVGRIPSAARRITRTRKSTKSAGSVEVVRPPLVDVTPEIKKDIVVVKPEPVKASEPAAKPAEKHEDFAKSLTEEPANKGFFSRLFGRK